MTICQIIENTKIKNTQKSSSETCVRPKSAEAWKPKEILLTMEMENQIKPKSDSQKLETPQILLMHMKRKPNQFHQNKKVPRYSQNSHHWKYKSQDKQRWSNLFTKNLQPHQESKTLPKTPSNPQTKRKNSTDTITVVCMKNSKLKKSKTLTTCATTWLPTINPLLISPVSVNWHLSVHSTKLMTSRNNLLQAEKVENWAQEDHLIPN